MATCIWVLHTSCKICHKGYQVSFWWLPCTSVDPGSNPTSNCASYVEWVFSNYWVSFSSVVLREHCCLLYTSTWKVLPRFCPNCGAFWTQFGWLIILTRSWEAKLWRTRLHRVQTAAMQGRLRQPATSTHIWPWSKAWDWKYWIFPVGGKQEGPEKNPSGTRENQCTTLLTLYGPGRESKQGHSG